MTLKQIEKIRNCIEKLNILKVKPTPEAISKIDSELENFFHKDYLSPHLNIGLYFAYGTKIGVEEMLSDIDSIISVLEGMLSALPYYGEIEYCLDLIDEGKRFIDLKEGDDDFQRKVINTVVDCEFHLNSVMNYYKEHPEKIHNENCTNLADMQQTVAILERYVESLIRHNRETELAYNKNQDTNININQNISSSASSTSNVTVDISVSFQNARQQAEDEGLPDEQYKAVMDKLAELEHIAKSKESKGKRWVKAKEIMKWLVEQGIQVAGILLPVLAQTIN